MISCSRSALVIFALGTGGVIALARSQAAEPPISALWPHPIPKIAVTTHHYDTFRTGWNSHEVMLTPSLRPPGPVAIQHFGLVRRVAVDDTVYAQPLIVPDVPIQWGASTAKHDIAYVVTENNSIYAIDANTGAILRTRHLGTAVSAIPNSCNNNGPRVGIESTPVIDVQRHAMYLIAFTEVGGRPVYRLHAIDLSTLNDQAPATTIAASHKLINGDTVNFNAADHRQRAALLLADGNIYAGFTSWCDTTPARGWLLGWRAFDLKPLPFNTLTDQKASPSKLASIWMAGSGIAAVSGHLYFVTGNTNQNGYDSAANLSESVVKVSSGLAHLLDFFTPSNAHELDSGPNQDGKGGDVDFGSGGVLLLPDQPGSVPHMAAAVGKDGRLFLLNREHLGGFNATDQVLDTKPVGSCWCTSSYYLNNIVSSGGSTIGVWHVNTGPTVNLVQEHASFDLGGSGDGGFFTSVSSNGANDVIIWAVSRSASAANGVPPPRLFAFEPVPGTYDLKLLFPLQPPGVQPGYPAGRWDLPALVNGTHSDANSTIVPVVANGHVYVASYRELDIFGFVNPVNELSSVSAGVIVAVNGPWLTLRTDEGPELKVDVTVALREGVSTKLAVGTAVMVYGTVDAQGVIHAGVVKPTHRPIAH
jgi:hypothetical protein